MTTKTNRRRRRSYGEPDGKTVVSAVAGDKKSLLSILDFYKGYISSLSTIRHRQENGREISFYDEQLRDELFQKLIDATLMFRTK